MTDARAPPGIPWAHEARGGPRGGPGIEMPGPLTGGRPGNSIPPGMPGHPPGVPPGDLMPGGKKVRAPRAMPGGTPGGCPGVHPRVPGGAGHANEMGAGLRCAMQER